MKKIQKEVIKQKLQKVGIDSLPCIPILKDLEYKVYARNKRF